MPRKHTVQNHRPALPIAMRSRSVLKNMDLDGRSSPELRKRGGKTMIVLALGAAALVTSGKTSEVGDFIADTGRRIDERLDRHNNPPNEQQNEIFDGQPVSPAETPALPVAPLEP